MSGKTKITLTQIRSAAGRDKRVKATLAALGLGRLGKCVELPSNAAVLGMVRKVTHLVKVS